MLTIARLNWPFYIGVAFLSVAAVGRTLWSPTPWLTLLSGLVLAGCVYFIVGSLGVSHQIYDRSDLYRWQWLDRALENGARVRIIFCHSGFDEASELLRQKLQARDWRVLDHFDATQMTEASIRRARKWFPPTAQTQPARFDHWPLETGSADVIFGLLAIHELRSESERSGWFAEAKRCLAPGGRIVLVEHVRDLANFLAFGPGFLHFHSPASWRRTWENAGLHLHDTFRVTPWVRIFVILP